MPSPFPGMNPYLEQPSVWEDFHNRFMAYVGEALATQVRPNFLVKLEERVYIHEPSADERRKWIGKRDIAVIGNSPTNQPIVATADPNLSNKVKSIITTLQDADIERHAFLEIRDRLDRELVTVVEVLSPTNKRYGPDREQYLLKQSAMMFVPTGWKPMPHQLGAVRLLLGNFEHQLAKILAIE